MKTYSRGIVHGALLAIVGFGLLYTLPLSFSRAEIAKSGVSVEIADPFPDRPVFLVQMDEVYYLVCVSLKPDYHSYLQTIRVRTFLQRPNARDIGLASDDNGSGEISEGMAR